MNYIVNISDYALKDINKIKKSGDKISLKKFTFF